MFGKKLLRKGGMAISSILLLTQLPLVPAQQALAIDGEITGKNISECEYVFEIEKDIHADEPLELNLEELGVPATETVSEIWMTVTSPDVEKTCMPAIGYEAPGLNEDDYYCAGCAITQENATIIFKIPDDAPLAVNFQIQDWTWDGATDYVTLHSLGLRTSNFDIGPMTRKGDVDNDKQVTLTDVVALSKYITGAIDTLAAPANGDFDGNSRLDARDLTLLKRALLNGTVGGTTDTGETAMEFVQHIKLGWNLGNTLDSTFNGAYTSVSSAETAWGCPYTTKEMLDTVKAAGFNCVRVPVSWGQKTTGAPDFKIDDAWMNRVQEVVDYVIDNDMYCILNIHHDNDKRDNGAYFYPDDANLENSLNFVSKIWTQVATRFEGYDSHLIFETLNEPRLVGTNLEWTGGDSASRAIVNQLNAKGLEAIRATGGNNTKRFVMMPGYAASSSANVLNDIVLPDDDHLIVDIHGYAPYGFALDLNGTNQWDQNSGSYDIVQIFEAAKSKFLSKGIPVIIGETGAMNKNNEDIRAEWAKFYFSTANSYGIPCVWWDNNCFNTNGENFGLINRNTLQVQYPKIMAAMVEATKDRG